MVNSNNYSTAAMQPHEAAVMLQRPVVMIDGLPRTQLTVTEVRRHGLLDQFSAALHVDAHAAGLPGCLLGERAELLVPVRWADEQPGWFALGCGTLTAASTREHVGADDVVLELIDDWERLLQSTIARTWWATASGLESRAATHAVIEPGTAGNRSRQNWFVGSTPGPVLQRDGTLWTLRDALRMIDMLAGLKLILTRLPADLGGQRLRRAINLSQPVHEILAAILRTYDLRISREWSRESGVMRERRMLLPANAGRKLSLTTLGLNDDVGDLLSRQTRQRAGGAEQWTARAAGRLVESTFELVPGWSASLEDEPDETYTPGSSVQFSRVSDVFRLWALNEDGHFSLPPFDRGDAYDLDSVFGRAGVSRVARAFEPCVTLDGGGRRLMPIIERSMDSGETWDIYTGEAIVRADRAAIYLSDSLLGWPWFEAVRAGEACVRVTAGLRDAEPVQVHRWRGNPFAGVLPPRVLDVSRAFRFQRVAEQSIHAGAIAAGELRAETVDDTAAMQQWLARRVFEHEQSRDVHGSAKLQLTGCRPALRLGDRIVTRGSRASCNGSCDRHDWPVRSIICRWPDPVRSVKSKRNLAPVTDVELGDE